MKGKLISLLGAGLAAGLFMLSDAATNPAQAACVAGVQNGDVLWMRAGPSARYRRVGALGPGTCGVQVLWDTCRRGGRWCKVNYAGERGWVNMRYIDEGGDDTYGSGSVLGTACVSGVPYRDVLWVRSGPSVRFRRKGKLPPGLCGITVHDDCRGNWCRITSPAGYTGWVNTRHLSFQ